MNCPERGLPRRLHAVARPSPNGDAAADDHVGGCLAEARDVSPGRPSSRASHEQLQVLEENRIAGDEGLFLGTRPTLQLCLAFLGSRARVEGFRVDNPHRPSCRRVFRVATRVVGGFSGLDVGCRTRVERAVGATEDVDEVHGHDDATIGEGSARSFGSAGCGPPSRNSLQVPASARGQDGGRTRLPPASSSSPVPSRMRLLGEQPPGIMSTRGHPISPADAGE
jgi:hypothetical protein